MASGKRHPNGSNSTYAYDLADNITQIFGSQNNYEQKYEYDEFNRLIHATGKGSGVFNSGKNCSCDVSYKYNIMSGFDNVVRNILKYDENKSGFVIIEENNAYLYGWDDYSGRYSKALLRRHAAYGVKGGVHATGNG